MMLGLPLAAALLCSGLITACRSDPPPDLKTVREKGYEELDRGHLDAAWELAERGRREAVAEGDRARAFDLLVLQAEVLVARRDADGALRLLAQPVPPGASAEGRGRASMIQGTALCQLAAHGKGKSEQSADELLSKAEQIASEASSPRLAAEVPLRQGTCHLQRGAHGQAETRFRQALSSARGSGMHRVEALAAGSLGLVRLLTARYDDAADWFERSLDLSAGEAVDLKNLGNLGWCYTMLGDTEKALPLLLKTEEIAARHGYTEDLELVLSHLGNVHIQLREFGAARNYIARALALARKLNRKGDQLELLGLLHAVALQAGDVAGAADYAREAAGLAASPGKESAADPTVLLVEARLHAERREFARARRVYESVAASEGAIDVKWRALAGIANLEVALGRPRAAERAFRQAQSAIEEMRGQLVQDTFDFLLFSSLNEFYGRYAGFLIDQGQVREALALVDRSRGRVLWERLGTGAAAARAPDRFEAAARSSNAVLLSYWLGERSFLWVVTPSSTEVHELPPAVELRSRVERYQQLVLRSRDPLELPGAEAAVLYKLLVGPAASRIPKGSRVVIVPDGPLHHLSFDTLVVAAPSPHYWVEDVITMRAPSLGLLTAARPPADAPDRALLSIGDPVQPSPEFPDLPNAAREIAEVTDHFPPEKVRVLTGSDATPTAYREADPSRFAYIHFAAHATSHAERPLESAVVLSRKDERYKLYASEIVNLPIHAEVVTLSACRGAGARTYRGEGLVGFAWAFLRAGARHVVAGLWNVEDASTSRLMSSLYARLAEGLTPPEALREARLALLRSPGAYRKPFYWGPFVIYVQQQSPAS